MKWEVGVTRPEDSSITRWSGVFVEAENERDAEGKAGEIGFYRNVRVRAVNETGRGEG